MVKVCFVDIDGVVADCSARLAWAEEAKQAFLQEAEARFETVLHESTTNKKAVAHFNISQEDYDIMFFFQAGLCAICGKPETKLHPQTGKVWPLRVDHDHETGQIRALLCSRRNTFVGYMEKTPEFYKKVQRYLRRYQ